MIAAEPAAAGDSRGWIAGGRTQRTRERDWLPGRCGLLPHSAPRSGSGRWPTVAVADSRSRGVGSATGFGKCGTPFERCSGWSGHSAAQRWEARTGTHVWVRLGWLARAAFF